MHKTEQGKGALWSGVYQREAVTALRTIRQQKGRILLENKDRYLVFLDRELDGSAKEKGTGPSLAAFKADKSTVIEAEIRNSWVNQLIFHSKNDFRCLDFALWSTETSCSNAEFESAIKKTPTDFMLPWQSGQSADAESERKRPESSVYSRSTFPTRFFLPDHDICIIARRCIRSYWLYS